jgi:hypothetical protein
VGWCLGRGGRVAGHGAGSADGALLHLGADVLAHICGHTM